MKNIAYSYLKLKKSFLFLFITLGLINTGYSQEIITASPLQNKCGNDAMNQHLEADGPTMLSYSWSELNAPGGGVSDATAFLHKESENGKIVLITGHIPDVDVPTTYGFEIILYTNFTEADSKQFEFEVYPTPHISFAHDTSICKGQSITLDAGSSLVYNSNYNWNTGDTTQTVTIDSAGVYSVTVTSDHGCLDNHSIEVVVNDIPSLILDSIIHATHSGGNDGAINITTTGGIVPYSYIWDNNDTTEDISGLAADTYKVIVTDSNHCSDTGSYQVDQLTNISGDETEANNYHIKVSPNPYYENISIYYFLSKETNVKLHVFDLLGRRIETIVNDVQQAGKYQYEFNTQRHEYLQDSYFLIFEFNDKKIYRKLIKTSR
jgi:hypothetical protein